MSRPVRHRYWLHGLLLFLTLLTSTAWGARMAWSFRAGTAPLADDDWEWLVRMATSPGAWIDGLPFSLTLLAILMAHEMGHYLACVYYHVEATLPYFLPAPAIIGTFGAFIRIRSPIFYRSHLFDIGIAGPIAGFIVLVPAMIWGMAMSKVQPGLGAESDLSFGAPLLQRLLEWWLFPGAPSYDIYLHPVARAAWAGTLATALNLLPIGQLDGGHILYAFVGDRHPLFSKLFTGVLVVLFAATHYWGWLVWAIALAIFAMRHPVIYDAQPLGPGRRILGLAAAAMLLLCFTVIPMSFRGLWN